MSEETSLKGLTCPQCGGMIPIPEGQVIVQCPYCSLCCLVQGEHGLLRYQVQLAAQRQAAIQKLTEFLSRNWAIARDARSQARVTESFLAYLPFWAVWARVMGWAFGQKKVGSGDNSHYESREIKIVEEMGWNGAACDVGEFGVNQVPLTGKPLEPFEAEKLHAQGMVFEPVNSFTEAHAAAEADIQKRIQRKANLDRLAQMFVRFLRQRNGLVYYPLWVVRYLYRGRSYQVVVDGASGQVLYGKAPGNTLYRAAALVLGMALGAFLSVDVSALILSDSHGDNSFLAGLGALVIGLGIMLAAYRRFRYGEQFEYRSSVASIPKDFSQIGDIINTIKDLSSGQSR